MHSFRTRFNTEGLEQLHLSLNEKTELLEKSKLGNGLALQELQTLAGYLDGYTAGAGTYICRQGDSSDFMCLVVRGRVSIEKSDLNHNQKEIASAGPGNTVGEMAMIDGEPRSASVVAKNQVQLLVLNDASFNIMAEEVPRLWGKILLQLAKIMSRRLRQTSGILAEYLQS